MHNNNIRKAIKKGITYPITTCQDFYTHYNEGTISKEDVISLATVGTVGMLGGGINVMLGGRITVIKTESVLAAVVPAAIVSIGLGSGIGNLLFRDISKKNDDANKISSRNSEESVGESLKVAKEKLDKARQELYDAKKSGNKIREEKAIKTFNLAQKELEALETKELKINYCIEQKYNNEILNHPGLLQEFTKIYGANACSRLIDLGNELNKEEVTDIYNLPDALEILGACVGAELSF